MITLRINGKTVEVDADRDKPLLWVLREDLGLTGSKFGCGVGQCLACLVHLDGQPAAACLTPLAAVGQREITTIEGLPADGSHPVQRAWMDLNVVQCGYCQSGQIMAAAALLARTPQPDEAAIDAALRGNLCRCGTYLRIRQAVARAAALAREA
ncbi:MAG: (2Fe-2S)-binding protein [Immundisolibacter sp.]|uniref:(2Fe-2S)-binding protein n=1 Tax=Immundisolibacter sp. TaxID=1934948 RepID=UPI003D10DAD5